MKPLNFSPDNIANQWKYLKRNLQDLGIWQDIERKVKNTIRFSIKTMLWEEFASYIGAGKYKRTEGRKDKRNGYYKRSLSTTYGRIDNILVPKARNLRPKFKVFDKYQRRQKEFDQMVLLSLILGLSTRKQKEFFENFIADSVSHTTASRILRKLDIYLKRYRNQKIPDNYQYLYLDGMWVHIKEIGIRNKAILFVLGMKEDGSKKILGFKLAKSESEQEWLAFLNDLYRRGLEGRNLKLIISDNCPGIKAALNFIYPYTPIQLCTTHKLRNILAKIRHKKKNRKELIKEASLVFKARNKSEAIFRAKRFVEKWRYKEPYAVKSFQKDLEDYLKYYDFPKEIRKTIKSTNPLERILRELRRTTRRIGYFQNQKSLELFIFAQIKEMDLLPEEGGIEESLLLHKEELVYA